MFGKTFDTAASGRQLSQAAQTSLWFTHIDFVYESFSREPPHQEPTRRTQKESLAHGSHAHIEATSFRFMVASQYVATFA